MNKILFPSFTTAITTGARYAESFMMEVLSSDNKLTVVDASALDLFKWMPSLLPLFGLYPYLQKRSYSLIVTSDNYIYCNMLYVQPHAGGAVKFPWLDTMTFKKRNQITSIFLKVLQPFARSIYRRTKLIANSKFTARLLRNEFNKDSSVLYPPVPIHLYDHTISARSNKIITLSALNPRKNLPFIGSVARHLQNKEFVLIGYQVNEHIDILAQIKNHFEKKACTSSFTYMPSLSNYAKAKMLNSSKVYFHPTIAEPFGIAVVEAMAAGCIPIVHNSGGVKEYVPRKWRYSTKNEAAELINQALFNWNSQIANQMREISRVFSEDNFKLNFSKLIDLVRNRSTS